MYATKIKIYIKVNGFRFPIPTFKINTIKRLTQFLLKHFKHIEIDPIQLKEDLKAFFKTISLMEPFELANVEVENAHTKCKVLIKTI